MKWYASKAGNDYQGIVADEETGETIAVAYDHKDTALLAAAPELLEALKQVKSWITSFDGDGSRVARMPMQWINYAISKAENN